MIRDANAVIRMFAKVAPPVLRRRFSPDCCLNATWIAQQVLQIFSDVKPLALSCRCAIVNPIGVRLGQPTDPHAWREAGGYLVVCGSGMKGWPGHAVLVAGDMLIDPSAAQFNRPAHGIEIDDVLIAERHGFPDTQPGLCLSVMHRGSALSYEAIAFDLSTLPDFGASQHNVDAGEEITELMDRGLS